ncbi:MAG: Serine/threonine-protein kinase [Cyanobacteriota bacterium]|jgi:formylglycine-generating enzyme required for sulfatase activity
MHGNVCEWCEDDWQENYTNAPINGSVLNSLNEITKLLRGGSWFYNPENCRSAYRCYNYLVNGNVAMGFRVVCSGAARTL